MEQPEVWIPILISGVVAIISLVWTFIQNIELQRQKGIIEKKSFVHKLQFEKEFCLYEELWEAIIELQQSIRSMDSAEPNKVYLKVIKLQFLIRKNLPFYPEPIVDHLARLISLMNEDITNQSSLHFNIEYKGQPDEALIKYILHKRGELGGITKDICDAIRKRIDNI